MSDTRIQKFHTHIYLSQEPAKINSNNLSTPVLTILLNSCAAVRAFSIEKRSFKLRPRGQKITDDLLTRCSKNWRVENRKRKELTDYGMLRFSLFTKLKRSGWQCFKNGRRLMLRKSITRTRVPRDCGGGVGWKESSPRNCDVTTSCNRSQCNATSGTSGVVDKNRGPLRYSRLDPELSTRRKIEYTTVPRRQRGREEFASASFNSCIFLGEEKVNLDMDRDR